MKNQKNETDKNNESSSLLQWGFFGLIAYGVVRYLNYLESDSPIENPEQETLDKSETAEEQETDTEKKNGTQRKDAQGSEQVNKYSEDIGEEIKMKVRKSDEPEKGTWLAILCRADGKESSECFYAKTKKEAIEEAFQEAISAYKEAFEE